MNTKNLTIDKLGIYGELEFIKSYHKYLLRYCIENDIDYDGQIAVKIIEMNNALDDMLDDPENILGPSDIDLLIRIAEGRLFLETTELSPVYNTRNTHDILRIPRYKIYHVLESHGY